MKLKIRISVDLANRISDECQSEDGCWYGTSAGAEIRAVPGTQYPGAMPWDGCREYPPENPEAPRVRFGGTWTHAGFGWYSCAGNWFWVHRPRNMDDILSWDNLILEFQGRRHGLPKPLFPFLEELKTCEVISVESQSDAPWWESGVSPRK